MDEIRPIVERQEMHSKSSDRDAEMESLYYKVEHCDQADRSEAVMTSSTRCRNVHDPTKTPSPFLIYSLVQWPRPGFLDLNFGPSRIRKWRDAWKWQRPVDDIASRFV